MGVVSSLPSREAFDPDLISFLSPLHNFSCLNFEIRIRRKKRELTRLPTEKSREKKTQIVYVMMNDVNIVTFMDKK